MDVPMMLQCLSLSMARVIVVALYVVCILSGVEAAAGGPQAAEKKALLLFRQGCERKDWPSVFGNWSSQDRHCQWSGVACNKKGFVKSLQLQGIDLAVQLQGPNNNITYKRGVPWGTYLAALQQLKVLEISGVLFGSAVPPELGSLSHLTTLTLSGCGLLGPIPPQFGNLSRLQQLDMSQQAGQVLSVLSASSILSNVNIGVGNLVSPEASSLLLNVNIGVGNLASIDINVVQEVGFPNGLPGFNGTAIPPQLCNLTRLTSLNLAWNLLGPTIPSCLFRLPHLSQLDLSNNRLTTATSTQLNDVLCSAPGASSPLSTLKMSHNALSGELPHCFFTNFTGLQGLDLGSNHLSGNLPPSVANFSQLGSLNLSYNAFSGAFQFSSFFLIDEVDVSNNNLTSMEELPLSLNIHNSVISTLQLGNNQFSGPFPSWIWCVSSLIALNLSMNNFSGQIVPTSDKCGENGPHSVDLHGNSLQGEVPWAVFQNCSLLNMASNHLSGEGLNLSNFNYLTYLDVSNNNLSGGVDVATAGPAMNMSLLGLSNNRFSGKLPAVCSDRTKVDNNFFSGSIPSEFLICSETLILHNNRLTGPIPDVPATSKLVLLDAAHNMLSGSLSSALFGLPVLQVLILGYNNFSGALPSWNSSPQKLQVIDLSNNRFTGTIPAQSLNRLTAFCSPISSGGGNHSSTGPLYNEVVVIIAKDQRLQLTYRVLEVVVLLDLSGNLLAGTIPWELGKLVSTTFLNLSGNHLEGLIPRSLGNLTELQSLDLSNNSLSGRIPDTFSQLHFISTLNVSYNQLEGPIPPSPQWENSASSFMGNPGLCGPPLYDRPCVNRSAGASYNNVSVLLPAPHHANPILPWPSILIGYVKGFAIVLPMAKCLLANFKAALFSMYKSVH